MRLDITTHRLFAPRLRRTLDAFAPRAVDAAADHFGRRPLAPVRIVLTSPLGLADQFVTTQRQAAKISSDAPTVSRLLEWRPAKVRCITGLHPRQGTVTFLNGRRLRRAEQLEDAVLFELAMVDQFLRRGAADRWVAHLRDLAGVDPLPRHHRARLNRELDRSEQEAAQAARSIRQRMTARRAAA